MEVYDLLRDEQLPLLLQRLQQQKSATLDELQLPAEAPPTEDEKATQEAAGSRAAIKARGKLTDYAAVPDCAHGRTVGWLRERVFALEHQLAAFTVRWARNTEELHSRFICVVCVALSVHVGFPKCSGRDLLAAAERRV